MLLLQTLVDWCYVDVVAERLPLVTLIVIEQQRVVIVVVVMIGWSLTIPPR